MSDQQFLTGLPYWGEELFSEQKEIGNGNFGKVFKVVVESTGACWAIKIFTDPLEENIETWKDEARHLQ